MLQEPSGNKLQSQSFHPPLRRSPKRGSHSQFHTVLWAPHEIFNQTGFLPPEKHLKTPAFTHDPVAETLIQAFVPYSLGCWNVVLFGVPSKALDRLQYVHNSAATVLTHTKP